jgi:hypothetical protein
MPTVDTRRVALVRDAGLARDALAEAALILENAADDPLAQAAVVQLQAEVDAAERRIQHHDLARAAAAREAEQRSSAGTEEQVAKHLQRIGDLHRSSTTRALKLLRAIEGLAGEWAALLADLDEARALTASAVHLRGGGLAVQRLTVHLDGHDVLAGAVGPALASTGLGITGPSLAPWIIVSPPSGAFAPVALGPALERLHERRLGAIERASTFAKTSESAA